MKSVTHKITIVLLCLGQVSGCSDTEALRHAKHVTEQFEKYAFSDHFPKVIYRRANYTYLGKVGAKGRTDDTVVNGMRVSAEPVLTATYEWIGSCPSFGKFNDLPRETKDIIYGVTVFPFSTGVSPGTVQVSKGYYADWIIRPSSFKDEIGYLEKIGSSREDYTLLPVAVSCSATEQKAAIEYHLKRDRPDRFLANEDGSCFVSFKFDPKNPYAIRGGEIHVLSRTAGRLSVDDPEALVCIVRGLAMHKGAMGAWDVPDAELLGPELKTVATGSGMGNKIEIASVGYNLLMHAPFQPGLSREEALHRLPEVENPLGCTLVPASEPRNGRPYFEDYKPEEC